MEFDDRTYPVKTSQGRWMNALVDFYIETILGDMVRILKLGHLMTSIIRTPIIRTH